MANTRRFGFLQLRFSLKKLSQVKALDESYSNFKLKDAVKEKYFLNNQKMIDEMKWVHFKWIHLFLCDLKY